MAADARIETRLFHAIVLVGAALGAGCGSLDGACTETISDAAADAKLHDGGPPNPCPLDAPANPIVADASSPIVVRTQDASVRPDAAPDAQPWPPTKC